jgi:outer membrane protein OmpA-like peptidoglycan-associated protein
MADPDHRRTDGPPPTHVHVEKKEGGVNWLPWLLGALALLGLLFALSRCGRDETAVVAPADNGMTATADNGVVAQSPDAPDAAPLAGVAAGTVAGVSGLGGYLAGAAPTPATFQFEKINFDTAKSDIRPRDREELSQVASVLKQHPNSRIRIAGYADARGADPANVRLGKARAEAVKAALVAQGIDAGRIETASGGEADPVDTNATTQGQAENRRTELVVTQR